MTRFLKTLALEIFLVFGSVPAWPAKIQLVYDGNLIDRAAIHRAHGTDYISLKSAASFLKGKTQWYPVAEKVVLQLNNPKITFRTGRRTVLFGNESVAIHDAPRIDRGIFYIPLDLILSEHFKEMTGLKIEWDESAQVLAAESPSTLRPPRIFTRTHSTKIVLESTEEFSPEIKRKEKLISIYIPKAKISSEEIYRFKDQPIEFVKTSRARKGTSIRIGLTDSATAYTSVVEKDPPRLTVEVPRSKLVKAQEMDEHWIKETIVQPKPMNEKASFAKIQTMDFRPLNKIKKIVIDAGHGGKDPGAIGKKGTKEKDINLLVALELARVLRIEGGYEVILTRQSDQFISLVDRSLLANENNADLFVSLHCNASFRKTEGGFEIYYLAEKASDPHAESTAEFENTVIELEGRDSAEKRKVQDLLFSMARNEFLNESSLLCHTISRSVKKRTAAKGRGVKQANFHVLHGAQMPSILIEMGFITNISEEQSLRQRKYRSALVDAVFTGIQNYESQLSLLTKAPQ